MLKKIFFSGIMALFVLSLLPISASATTASTSLVPGTLIRGSSDSVYYYGADGKRYVFPTEKTYKSWFLTFDPVIAISNELLSEFPIGGNVTYKPGVKLVKITTDPKVYYVDLNSTLRWVASEALAKNLWGSTWYTKVDDVADTSLLDYKKGEPLENPELTAVPASYSINQDKSISTQPDPVDSQLSKITLTGTISTNTINLKWTTTNISADQGFKVVWANQPDPVYPGNEYHYLSDPSARSDTWEGLFKGTYYFRVCEYQGGKCGIYSDNVAFIVENGINTGTKSITAMSEVVTEGIKIKWTTNISSPSGFKIVKAEHVNPVYPGDEYHYLSSPLANIDLWSDLPVGTWHFRVCEYLGGSCGTYSNDVTVTISGSATNTGNKTITLNKSISGNTVSLSWVPSFTSSQGFKIVKAEHLNPIYPGDDYHYLSDSSARSDKWEGLSAGTYHFRVCEYLGGSCGVYSNDVTVTIAGTTATTTKTITAASVILDNDVKIKWTSSFTSASGFKIVKAEHVNPIYPGDEYHYLSSSSATSDLWSDLAAGTYHFRVCEYLGGKCGVYSNDLTVTIAGTTTETSNGSISLSGNVNSGNVYLNWVLTGMTSSMGFKVVKAEHVNPIYPGDEYHYYSDASLRTDTWEGLSAGTYHFRVCEYLGGSCGVYSNDLVLTVQ